MLKYNAGYKKNLNSYEYKYYTKRYLQKQKRNLKNRKTNKCQTPQYVEKKVNTGMRDENLCIKIVIRIRTLLERKMIEIKKIKYGM